jgi:hypothetical protein
MNVKKPHYTFQHFLAYLWILSVVSCSAEFIDGRSVGKTIRSLVVEESDSREGGKSADGNGALTFDQAFSGTVYPLVMSKCGPCHESTNQPFFAVTEQKSALSAITDSNMVNFAALEKSRIVQRIIKDQHQCGEHCSDDGQAMLGKLQEWKSRTISSAIEEIIRAETANRSSEYFFNATTAALSRNVVPGTIIFEAEKGTIRAPFKRLEDEKASGGSFISSANDGITKVSGDPLAGSVTYRIKIEKSGLYYVYANIQTVVPEDDSVYIKVDHGPLDAWKFGATAPQELKWVLANTENGGSNLKYSLSAGTHTLELSEREDGSRIDAIAVSDRSDFIGGVVSNSEINTLKFDLASLMGEGSSLELEAAIFDKFSYQFKNPTLINGRRKLHFKGLRILVNGYFDPKSATYATVDATVEPDAGLAISDAVLLVPMDLGADQDKIAIQFDEITLE